MKYREIEKLTADVRQEKWWENNDKEEKKDGLKWHTLRHNGVLFPPEYKRLPKDIKVLYKKKPVKLDAKNTDNKFNISEEEAMFMFANKLEQDQRLSEKNKKRVSIYDDEVFLENFWKDWKKILGKDHVIQDLERVDFQPVIDYIAKTKEEKKKNKKSKEEKEEEKEQKQAVKDLYGYAVVDGTLMPVGKYVIEPPGIFAGHAKSPIRGRIKGRLAPSDITLNISKEYVPKCQNNGEPCKWGNIVEDRTVTWLASWKDPLTEAVKYVTLSRAESMWVFENDMVKFDKARKLTKNIESVREKYTNDLDSSDILKKQFAVATYLLDKLAIRPGTEKDEKKEADTLGLTTLKCDNVSFLGSNSIEINFFGKSSIEFKKTFDVDERIYKYLKKVCKDGKKLFPDITANSLNEYLKTLMTGLTSKVFRTWKASTTLEKQLNKTNPDENTEPHEKRLMYDRANIKVAKALNHKKLGDNDAKIEKLKAKANELEDKYLMASTDAQQKRLQKSLDLAKAKLEEAELNIATSTSKDNYMDPRITVAWCKKHDVQIEKIFNKTQLKKFVWSMETESDWKF